MCMFLHVAYSKRNSKASTAFPGLGREANTKGGIRNAKVGLELRRVTDFVATRKHAARNRAMLLSTHLAGMRVGEVAALRISDVLDMDGNIRNEIRLDAEQTKGQYARVVFVGDKLRKELAKYLALYTPVNREQKQFYTQKRMSEGFTGNTLTQHFHHLYRAVGIEGASSHSGRRSFITNLASKGVGVRVLMSLAGHRNPRLGTNLSPHR